MSWLRRVSPLSGSVLIALSTVALACSDDGGEGADDEVGESAGESSDDGTDDTTETTDGDAETTTDDAETTTDTGEPEPATEPGCEDAEFYTVPEDPAERGPWAVGAKTVVIDGLTTEIWYPAQWGSEAGADLKGYDLRAFLPESEAAKIPDEKAPPQVCDCYDDLPIDAAHGPYPVVVFVHGTASWRSQSLSQVTHWASRGFVVVSSDHPGLMLGDILGPLCGLPGGQQDLSGDTDAVLAALAAPSGDWAFLDGLIDTERMAVSGHSAGGSAAANQADKPGMRVSIPMASGQPVVANPAIESSLFLGGNADGVVPYSSTQSGYAGTAAPKRLVGIENAGHLAFSDICEIENDEGQDILEVAVEADVCGASLAGFLFDCSDSFVAPEIATAIINHSSTAVLEEVLKCQDDDAFAEFEASYPDVAEFLQEL